MKDNFIENKLKDHICRFNDGEHNCDCYIAGVTDYHNHIVEIIDNIHPINSNNAIDHHMKIKSLLQDTNPKEL